MRKVWKFSLPLSGWHNVSMPAESRLLCVREQDGGVRLWALCPTHTEQQQRTFLVAATGQEVVHDSDEAPLRYVGTAHLPDGGRTYVAHVFEAVPASEWRARQDDDGCTG